MSPDFTYLKTRKKNAVIANGHEILREGNGHKKASPEKM